MKRSIITLMLLFLLVGSNFIPMIDPASESRSEGTGMDGDRQYLERDNVGEMGTSSQTNGTRSDTEPTGEWRDDFFDTGGIEWKAGVTVEGGSAKMDWWKYRKPITVTNNGDQLKDFQIPVLLNASNFNYSRADPEGDDIRFLDENGTELAYWIEHWNGGGNSKIWVNVPSISNSTSYIWIHYGNPNALSRSSGVDVFELFDDFEDDTLGNNVVPGGWTVDRAGTYRYGLENKDGSKCWWQYCERWAQEPPNGGRARIFKDTDLMSKWIFEGRVLTYNAYNNNLYTPWLLLSFGSSAATAYLRHVNPNHVCFIGSSGYQPFLWNDDTWYDFKVTYDSQVHRLYFDDDLKASWAHPGDSTSRFYLGSGYFGKNYYDIPRVRKYAAVEPLSSVGPEQGNPGPFIVSVPIEPPGKMQNYSLRITKSETEDTFINVSVVDADSNTTVSGYTNLTNSFIDLTPLFKNGTTSIRLKGWFSSNNDNVPFLDSWKVDWLARPPELLRDIESIQVFEDTPTTGILNISEHFFDIYSDPTPPRYALEYISDPTNIILEIQGHILNVVYLAENFSGNVAARINCTNIYNQVTSSNTFMIRVQDIDDAPLWLSVPPDILMEEDTTYLTNYSLDEHIFDSEGNELEYIFSYCKENLTVELDGDNGIKVVPRENHSGICVLEITATETDGDHLSAAIEIPVTVLPVNDAPWVMEAVDPIQIPEDSVGYLEIGSIFNDPDDPDLLYMAAADSKDVNLTILVNDSLLIEPKMNWFGEAMVALTAMDPQGEKGVLTFDLTVERENDIPLAFIEPRRPEMEYEDGNMEISGWGTDADGAIVQYRWESSLDGHLGNTSSLNLFSIENLSLGRHLLNFSVMDNDGAWSEERIMEIFIKAPKLEVVDISIKGEGVDEGGDVPIGVSIANRGTAVARDVKVVFYVDDEVLESHVIYHIFPGEIKSVNSSWRATLGKHNITIEVMDKNNYPVMIKDGFALDETIKVESDDDLFMLLLSIGSCFLALVSFLLVSALLRKRRRKRIYRKVRRRVEEANRYGVGVRETEDMLGEIDKEFL